MAFTLLYRALVTTTTCTCIIVALNVKLVYMYMEDFHSSELVYISLLYIEVNVHVVLRWRVSKNHCVYERRNNYLLLHRGLCKFRPLNPRSF